MLDLLGEYDPDRCFLYNFVHGIEAKSWVTQFGERLSPFYPKNAKIFMSPERTGTKLESLIGNTQSMLIVSSDFKEAIEKHCEGVDIEYLPFSLYDHRRRVLSKDYFIVNPIGTFDCLDFKASDITWDDDEPDSILSIREHVLDKKKMKSAPQLFRIDQAANEYVVGLALAREMYDHDFTNVRWTELRFGDEVRKKKKK